MHCTEGDVEDIIVTDRDIIHAWDVDEDDTAGQIPSQQFEELILKLKGYMRHQKKARIETFPLVMAMRLRMRTGGPMILIQKMPSPFA